MSSFLKRAWCVILHHHEELWTRDERGYHVMCPSCGWRSPGWNNAANKE